MATERRIGKDEDTGDTIRVEKADLDLTPPTPARPVLSRAEGPVPPRSLPTPRAASAVAKPAPPPSAYLHVPAPDDMTPLPPPKVQASIIAEEMARPLPSVPAPLPPAPAPARVAPGVPGVIHRPLERASLSPRRISLPGPPTAAQLVDPVDAQWTLGLRIASGVLVLVVLAWLGKVIYDVYQWTGDFAVWTLLPFGILALAWPAFLLAQLVTASRVATAGIEVGAEQLRDAWQLYVDVAVRLGVSKPPPLYVLDGQRVDPSLLALARRRCIAVRWSDFASNETLELALARELGAMVMGHDDVMDRALLVPSRWLFGALAWPLRKLGLGISPFHLLSVARAYSSDRAACVGTGDLGLVTDDLLGAGDRDAAARVDLTALEAQHKRTDPATRVLHDLASPVPSLGERVQRLQRFAAPHLVQ